jgi:hypothetical protein
MRTKPINVYVKSLMGKHQHTYPNTQGKKKDKVLMVMYAVADIINKINKIALN